MWAWGRINIPNRKEEEEEPYRLLSDISSLNLTIALITTRRRRRHKFHSTYPSCQCQKWSLWRIFQVHIQNVRQHLSKRLECLYKQITGYLYGSGRELALILFLGGILTLLLLLLVVAATYYTESRSQVAGSDGWHEFTWHAPCMPE